MTRRAFLRLLGIGLGGAACGRIGSTLPDPFASSPAPTLVPLPASATPFLPAQEVPTQAPPTPVSYPDLVVARGSTPEQLVRQGLASVRLSAVDALHQDELYSAQLAAQRECLGLWACN